MNDNVKQLAWALDIIASRCPRGLAAIVGEANPPTYDELVAAATWNPTSDACVRTTGQGEGPLPFAVECILRVSEPLEKTGWKAISAAGKEVKRLYPKDWEAYRLHVTYIESPVQWRADDQTTLERIAKICNMDIRTVQRRRRQVPYQIAWAALHGVQGAIDFP